MSAQLAPPANPSPSLDPLAFRIVELAKSVAADRARELDIQEDEPLVQAGLDSVDLVNLMLAVEAEFGILIPPKMMNPANFKTVTAIARMVRDVQG